MKKLLLLFFVTCTFAACKKDNTEPTVQNSFSVKGTSYNFVQMTSRDVNNPLGIFTVISNVDKTGNTMRVSVNSKAAGNFAFDNINDVYLAVGLDEYLSVNGKGSITITRFDSSVTQGTFSGTFESLNDGAQTTASGLFTVNK